MDIIAGDLDSSGIRNSYCGGDTNGLCAPGTGVVAYTLLYFDENGNIVGSDIYTCENFFTDIPTNSICSDGIGGLASKGGVILHELSHATSGTNDIAYGCDTVVSLSDEDKYNNADNYRCMGEAIYLHYRC